MFDATEQDYLNRKHLSNPEPGDYWNEMFCPVRVVLIVTPETVTFCEKVKATDATHWTWDLSEVKKVLREDFHQGLLYATLPKTFCDVSPRSHIAFVDHFTGGIKGEAT